MVELMSILDTDLYKLTMQQAVQQQFPTHVAKYRFKNRSQAMYFTPQCAQELRESIDGFKSLSLSSEELTWLQDTCPYFTKEYLDYLLNYRFKPDQVTVTYVPNKDNPDQGQIEMVAEGPWIETILWETPLMALLSEIYFRTVDKDWVKDGQEALAYAKGKRLLEAGCQFSEFGTRRRRSSKTHDHVVAGLKQAQAEYSVGDGKLVGTSNVHLARIHGLAPIGTIAHEWFMGIATIHGYPNASSHALSTWEAVYSPKDPTVPPTLFTSLTDTFSTIAFLNDIRSQPEAQLRMQRWTLRQDSGDPFNFITKMKDEYPSFNVDVKSKTIVFSDSLDVDTAIALKKACDEVGFKASFGIGTFLTNDFQSNQGGGKSKALNIVIKLASLNGKPCVKISDDIDKNTGDFEEVKRVKRLFGLLPA